MPKKKNSKIGIVISTVISFILIGSALLLVINRQYIIDQITVWQYTPTSEISRLADRSGMNKYGEFIFYSSQPKLDATDGFNSVCERVEQTTSILGCYSNWKIYIYNVSDENLDGVREVTAAHEMLHAAYARLSDQEIDDLDILLESEYKKLESNKDFTDRIALYDKVEPGQRYNELHSVIGTEVANISPELEMHYEKYFQNRQLVTELNDKYISVFKILKIQADNLIKQLDALETSIVSRSNQYNNSVQILNDDILDFNNRANNEWFTSQMQFDIERSKLSARMIKLETARTGISNDTQKYSSIVDQYNAITSQSKKLYNSIDSTLAPAPSI